jgi:transposase
MTRRSCVERFVSDALWELVEPLLPKPRKARRGRTGRPRVPDRAALAGIVFVLKTGISPNALPAELGFGSGVTCWRRLREWQDAGVWQELHRVMLDRLAQRDLLDWSRAAVDSVSVRAKRRGELTGPSPTDRGKAGSKYHVLCDRDGLPLHALVTGANTHDSRMLAALMDTNPGVREHAGRPGRPRRRPGKLHAEATTTPDAAVTWPNVGSGCGSHDVGSRTPPGSGGSAGSSSARCPGCWTSAAWRCGMTAPSRRSPRCCHWRVL